MTVRERIPNSATVRAEAIEKRNNNQFERPSPSDPLLAG